MARYDIAEHVAFVQRLAHDARFRWFLDRGNTEGPFRCDMLAKDRRLFDGNHVVLRTKRAGLFDARYFAVETTRLKEWGADESGI